jgi:hypothetical protein
MAILSKGATIVADTQVSATNLNNLVDAATFVSGAVDGTTTQLSGGAIIVKDSGITPAKLSTGGPSWTSGGNLAVTGSTSVGTTSSSGQLTIGQVTNAVVDNAIILRTGSTKTAWLIGAQYLSDNSFEVIPSTAVGGTTFTTPVFRVNTSGVTVTGTITGTLTGNASTATNVAYSGLTGTVPTWNQSTTGNAATATKIASITNSDIVQLTESQTLTNKTLTSPTITGTGAIAGSFTGPLTGNIISSIANITLLDLVPEFGYATSGTITLNLAAASNAKIELSGNSTFALSGIDSGQVNIVALKNNTGGTITTSWPAWTSAGGTFPASLTSGQAMVVSLYSYGSTTGSVYAVSSL